jgi:hypothetical protein
MPLTDEQKTKYKEQFRKITATAQFVATLTPTPIDDKIVGILSKIANNDELMSDFFALGDK